ncbi:MAG: tRNA pseudouridine(38-40) synthase TruA [Ignavibacteria bacterium]|nr:tRNA pseudouridine(38-40) synthase TruA [Ignavibacteria bacterium]
MTEVSRKVNLKLVIEYDGKNYCGWQSQAPSAKNKTIQQTIEESLQVLFPDEIIKLYGAGRTDAGVHAYGQVANFKVAKSAFDKLGNARLLKSLNGILPGDIAVKSVKEVNERFHSRYSARLRVYKYYITTEKKGIGGDKYFHVKPSPQIDVDLAKNFCKLLVGIHSFESLCKNKDDRHDFLCDVKYVKVKRINKTDISVEICASRFLHSMVRGIIGAMLSVSTGKMQIKDFAAKFKKGDKIKIQYVPANALFLLKVKY